MTDTPNPVVMVMDPLGHTGAVVGQLSARYGASYTIAALETPAEALQALQNLADQGTDVALLLADRAAGGAALLERARALHPHAR
jgi:hypothetical protein